MRSPLPLLAALTVLAMTGAACGSGGSDDVAVDPAPTSSSPPPPPAAAVPAGPVRTRELATVMDTGTPQLCVGPIAESYPPQCGGPAITNWDWKTLGREMYDEQGDIRWGSYLVTGTWDGTSFTATDAIPAALYDPAVSTQAPTPAPARAYGAPELEDIAQRLSEVPGVLASYGGEGSGGHVLVDVFYDDGSLQEWADAAYGERVVLVSSALVD